MKQYSRREILRAMMLGGGVIAGELWWPGQKLISIPSIPVEEPFNVENLRFTATERYSYGWVDQRSGFGLALVKPEGGVAYYDSEILEGNEQALVFSEDSLEQIVIDIRRDQKDFPMSIKPRTIIKESVETFGKDEAKRQARQLGADQAHGLRLNERIIRV